MDNHYIHKYIKYKNKCLKLIQQIGGIVVNDNGNGNNQVKRNLLLYMLAKFDGSNLGNYDLMNDLYDRNVTIHVANKPSVIGIMKSSDRDTVDFGIQFGSGEWIAVEQKNVGIFDGSGKCQPIKRPYDLNICVLAKLRNSMILEENIYYDNHSYFKQLGIDKNCLDKSEQTQTYGLVNKLSFVTYGRVNEVEQPVHHRIIQFENFYFNYYNKRNWATFLELFDVNAIIIFSNGQHVKGLNQIFRMITDNLCDGYVVSFPIHFGSGDWTAASMITAGTINDISWCLEHCVLVKWDANDKIIEQHIYFDNDEFERQTGKQLII